MHQLISVSHSIIFKIAYLWFKSYLLLKICVYLLTSVYKFITSAYLSSVESYLDHWFIRISFNFTAVVYACKFRGVGIGSVLCVPDISLLTSLHLLAYRIDKCCNLIISYSILSPATRNLAYSLLLQGCLDQACYPW